MLGKVMIGTVVGVMAFSGAPFADEFTDWCLASIPQGADASMVEDRCACLAKATEGEDDARNSMEAAGDIADRDERFAALNPKAQEAVRSCR